MNIFYLHNDPTVCARQHVDKHVVKMILEYAQLLSTAHRVLDGNERTIITESGRKKKVWALGDDRDSMLYSATHINHPSAKWARDTLQNYNFLFTLWVELMREYHYRYGKIHASARLLKYLKNPPKSIPSGEFSAPWRAMPDEYKVDGDTIQSYRNYYNGAKTSMFKWKNREKPEWAI